MLATFELCPAPTIAIFLPGNGKLPQVASGCIERTEYAQAIIEYTHFDAVFRENIFRT